MALVTYCTLLLATSFTAAETSPARKGTAVSISGVVKHADGRTASGALIRCLPTGEAGPKTITSITYTDDHGKFTLPDLVDGMRYELMAISDGYALVAHATVDPRQSGNGIALSLHPVASAAPELGKDGVESYRGFLGVSTRILPEEVRANRSPEIGAEVTRVIDHSAADQAGIQRGDLIISIEGQTIVDGRHLVEFVRSYKSGDEVNVVVAPDQAHRIRLSDYFEPWRKRAAKRYAALSQGSRSGRIRFPIGGGSVTTVNRSLLLAMNVAIEGGVAVSIVDKPEFAKPEFLDQFETYDIIVSIGGRSIETGEDFIIQVLEIVDFHRSDWNARRPPPKPPFSVNTSVFRPANGEGGWQWKRLRLELTARDIRWIEDAYDVLTSGDDD